MTDKRLLTIGLIAGLITAILTFVYLYQMETGRSFLRLPKDVALAKDQTISDIEKLESIKVPSKFADLIEVFIEDSKASREWLKGRVATQDLKAGAVLPFRAFEDAPNDRFSATISSDKRAISIPVNSVTAVSYLIEPGNRVDILGTFDRPLDTPSQPLKPTSMSEAEKLELPSTSRLTVTTTLLQNVKVLAVGKATTRGEYVGLDRKGYDSVTVEVSPADAEKLTFALGHAIGGLALVLRNPENDQNAHIGTTGWSDIVFQPAK